MYGMSAGDETLLRTKSSGSFRPVLPVHAVKCDPPALRARVPTGRLKRTGWGFEGTPDARSGSWDAGPTKKEKQNGLSEGVQGVCAQGQRAGHGGGCDHR